MGKDMNETVKAGEAIINNQIFAEALYNTAKVFFMANWRSAEKLDGIFIPPAEAISLLAMMEFAISHKEVAIPYMKARLDKADLDAAEQDNG